MVQVGPGPFPQAAEEFLQEAANGDLLAVRKCLEGRNRRQFMVAADAAGRGAAHFAGKAGHVEVLKLLSDHGASMDSPDSRGRTPLHLACEHGQLQATRLLLDIGARPAAQDTDGRTPLHLASCSEDRGVCGCLVERCPQLLEVPDSHGRTPLFYAVLSSQNSALDVISQLLASQSQVNCVDVYGLAPLHYAAEASLPRIIALLLSKAADPTLEDVVGGRTPADMADNELIRSQLRAAAVHRRAAKPIVSAQEGLIGDRALDKCLFPEVGQVPAAVKLATSKSFQATQSRFKELMARVQEVGISKREHLRRPHLFNGSWMNSVQNHSDLLERAFRQVPGPEVCLRVFNLLHPPTSLPLDSGDDRDVGAHYARLWDFKDGPSPSALKPGDEGGPSRFELLHQLAEQRQELEKMAEELKESRWRANRLQTEVETSSRGVFDAEEEARGSAQGLDAQLLRSSRQLAAKGEALRLCEARARDSELSVASLRAELGRASEHSAFLESEQCALRRRLDQELTRRGEEESFQLILAQERLRADVVNQRFGEKLLKAETEAAKKDRGLEELRARCADLQAELVQARSVNQAPVVPQVQVEVEPWRQEAAEARLEAATLRSELAESAEAAVSSMKALKAELGEERWRLSEALKQLETAPAPDTARVQELDSVLEGLRRDLDSRDQQWHQLLLRYPLISQAFFSEVEARP